MEIWLDGTDTDLIKWGNQLGILSGVTTNPAIIAASGKSLEENLKAILKNHVGPVAVQVIASKAEDIVEQAETLRDFSERIIVKIPVTQQGLKAMHSLSHLQLPIMATSILTPSQFLLACHAGATLLAPYFSHIHETGIPAEAALEIMMHTTENYGFEAKIVAASINSLSQMMTCLELGINAVTLPPHLIQELITDHPLTEKYIEKFHEAAKKGSPSRLIPT